MYKPCECKGYVYNLTAYLDKNRKCVTRSITITRGTIIGIKAMSENVGHRLYIDNFFHLQHHLMTYVLRQ